MSRGAQTCVGQPDSQPSPSSSLPSKRCGSGGRTRNRRWEMSPQSRSVVAVGCTRRGRRDRSPHRRPRSAHPPAAVAARRTPSTCPAGVARTGLGGAQTLDVAVVGLVPDRLAEPVGDHPLVDERPVGRPHVAEVAVSLYLPGTAISDCACAGSPLSRGSAPVVSCWWIRSTWAFFSPMCCRSSSSLGLSQEVLLAGFLEALLGVSFDLKQPWQLGRVHSQIVEEVGVKPPLRCRRRAGGQRQGPARLPPRPALPRRPTCRG